jgi:hypothetical protein
MFVPLQYLNPYIYIYNKSESMSPRINLVTECNDTESRDGGFKKFVQATQFDLYIEHSQNV